MQVKRQPRPVKILLLGQSESGKSTTLKNFQLMCEPKSFHAERTSWRAIIQLNVLRSFRVILDSIAFAANSPDRPFSADSIASSRHVRDLPIPDEEVLALRKRLLPLLEIEDAFVRRLGSRVVEASSSSAPMATTSRLPSPPRRAGKEVAINSAAAWKTALIRQPTEWEFNSMGMANWENPNDPSSVLHARSIDMRRLWTHPIVRAILEARGLRLQESSGFFLDELETITAPNYLPTDDHILRARLKTLGVSEHRMQMSDPYGGVSREFRIFDVGGQRSMRPKWVPYFDDVDAIIFLAPISAFDQTLVEDRHVNRLADCVELWTSIVSHRLLQKANIILFLNKVDILNAKLASGIQLADFMPSYGRRPNDLDSASRYLKKQFSAILKQSSPVPRVFYCHLTNVIDTKSTAYVLVGLTDMLIRFNLQQSHLIL